MSRSSLTSLDRRTIIDAQHRYIAHYTEEVDTPFAVALHLYDADTSLELELTEAQRRLLDERGLIESCDCGEADCPLWYGKPGVPVDEILDSLAMG